MLTDKEIQDLITTHKIIITRYPAKGYKEEDGHRRCDLTLNSTENEGEMFSAFIRQNSQFIENYSIGLRYKTKNKSLGTVTIVRYNGPHGETDWSHDSHYNNPPYTSYNCRRDAIWKYPSTRKSSESH